MTMKLFRGQCPEHTRASQLTHGVDRVGLLSMILTQICSASEMIRSCSLNTEVLNIETVHTGQLQQTHEHYLSAHVICDEAQDFSLRPDILRNAMVGSVAPYRIFEDMRFARSRREKRSNRVDARTNRDTRLPTQSPTFCFPYIPNCHLSFTSNLSIGRKGYGHNSSGRNEREGNGGRRAGETRTPWVSNENMSLKEVLPDSMRRQAGDPTSVSRARAMPPRASYGL